MYYYQFHIGDYQSDTRHLELLEDLAYRRMLDLYYKSESPLPEDTKEIARLIGMRSHEPSIEIVLHDFFERTDDGWKNNKADEVLNATYTKSEKAKRSAQARWDKRKVKKPQQKQEVNANAMRTQCESDANGMLPITHNPLPITHNNNPPLSPQGESDNQKSETDNPTPKKPVKRKTNSEKLDWSCWPAMPDQQILDDWLAFRKSKAPVSQTVINTFGKELHLAAEQGFDVDDCLATCVTRGWRGFKAEWMTNQNGGQGNAQNQQPRTSAAGRVRANAQRELEEIRRQEEIDNALATDEQHVWSQVD